MRRVFGPALLAETICLLVSTWPMPIMTASPIPLPAPSPRPSGHLYQCRMGVTVSGLSSGWLLRPSVPHSPFPSSFMAQGSLQVAHSAASKASPIRISRPCMCLLLDWVSAATVACTHYYGDRFYGLPTAAPRPVLPSASSGRLTPRTASTTPRTFSKHPLRLFHGRDDRVVPAETAEALKKVYEGLGLRAPQLRVEWNESGCIANHGMPVAQFMGESRFPKRECGQHEPPYVVQCGYDAAHTLFRHLYDGGVVGCFRRSPQGRHARVIDQSEFFPKQQPASACILSVTFTCQRNVSENSADFMWPSMGADKT